MFDSPSTSSSSLDSYPGSAASLYDPVLIQPPDDLEPLPFGLSLLDEQKHLYSSWCISYTQRPRLTSLAADDFAYSGLELTVAPVLMDPQPYRARVPDYPVVATTDDVPIIAPTPRHAYNQFEAVMGFDPDDLLTDQQSPQTQPPAAVAPPQQQSQHRGTGTAVAPAVLVPLSQPVTPSRKRSHEMAFVQEDMHLAEGLAPGALSRKRARRSSTLAAPLHVIQPPVPSAALHWNQSAFWQHAQSAAYGASHFPFGLAPQRPRLTIHPLTPTRFSSRHCCRRTTPYCIGDHANKCISPSCFALCFDRLPAPTTTTPQRVPSP